MDQKNKINKKAYLDVTDIGVDLLGKLGQVFPSQVRSLLSKTGFGVTSRDNFENQYSICCILMHSSVYQDNSCHFHHISGQLNISGQIQT